MAIRTQGEHRRTSPGQLLRTRSGLQYTLPLCHAQSQRVADPVPKAPPSTGRCTPLSQCRALPSVCPGTSQGRAARGKMTRRNSTSPSALWDPPLPSCTPHPWGRIPIFHHLWGWEAAELGWGTGRANRFKETLSCCKQLGHSPETHPSHLRLHWSHSLPLGVISMSYLAG